ncbi:DUF3667 domain-containing protein [Neolewinella aurantiaca]|uniref:DUF3667 domain-containing protein n=1 Tax=Neolewinella aurantiaca TaxID=2602767 RepID=A0A5C7FUB0_9BACT|nr:DUF3667 domain-containing protein [Neolewinella aurantiaca]TXF89001.1 DUF3667 domain-containing protein [Neolewinella aurantiaca]
MDYPPSIPSPSVNCTNCGAEMSPEARWCPSCGQKAYEGPPGFWQLLADFFETAFSLDNRLFRTLLTLVVPGKLTNRFLAGKQKPYFHPLRLFFVLGVLAVATYSLYTAQAVGDSLEQSLEHRKEQAYFHRFEDKLEAGIDSIITSFPEDASVVIASDSLLKLLTDKQSPNPDSFSIGFLAHEGGLNFKPRQVNLLYDDFQLMTPEGLAEKYTIKGVFHQYQLKQIVRITRLDLSGLTAMMGQIIWGLLLLVPLAGALLKLIYIRRKRHYVEHFIFTLHIHAFIFLTQFLAAMGLLLFDSTLLLVLSGIGNVVYFLLSLKRVYRQSWGKTIIKAGILSWGYLFLLTFTVSFTAIIAVLVF